MKLHQELLFILKLHLDLQQLSLSLCFLYPFYQLILHLAENDRNQNNDGVSKINVYFSFTLKDVQR